MQFYIEFFFKDKMLKTGDVKFYGFGLQFSRLDSICNGSRDLNV